MDEHPPDRKIQTIFMLNEAEESLSYPFTHSEISQQTEIKPAGMTIELEHEPSERDLRTNVPYGEVWDKISDTENTDDSMSISVIQTDLSKEDGDSSKAMTFSEDFDVYNFSDKASLHFPITCPPQDVRTISALNVVTEHLKVNGKDTDTGQTIYENQIFKNLEELMEISSLELKATYLDPYEMVQSSKSVTSESDVLKGFVSTGKTVTFSEEVEICNLSNESYMPNSLFPKLCPLQDVRAVNVQDSAKENLAVIGADTELTNYENMCLKNVEKLSEIPSQRLKSTHLNPFETVQSLNSSTHVSDSAKDVEETGKAVTFLEDNMSGKAPTFPFTKELTSEEVGANSLNNLVLRHLDGSRKHSDQTLYDKSFQNVEHVLEMPSSKLKAEFLNPVEVAISFDDFAKAHLDVIDDRDNDIIIYENQCLKKVENHIEISTPKVKPTFLDPFEIVRESRTSTGDLLAGINFDETNDRPPHVGEASKTCQAENGHKEFTVVLVNEMDLATGPSNKAATPDIISTMDTPEAVDREPLCDKRASTCSDGPPCSPEFNNHDTIGPLDNPAFLRTLHYTESQYANTSQLYAQDDNIAALSNLDLRSLTVYQDTPDLDKGWAWVILAVGFFSSTLLGATVYASGVLMTGILKEINPDLTKVSWVGSVNVCVMYLSGPFVGGILKKLGARLTVSLAGIVVAIGFIGASFSTTVSQLILTHGIVSGLGAGYIINPVFVAVGQYFNKYRGVACSLLACGAGVGILTGGAIVSVLLDHYGLSGTYLIWSGLMLNITPAGMLLRPSPEERQRNMEMKRAPDGEPLLACQCMVSCHNSMTSGLNSYIGSGNHSVNSGLDKIGRGRKAAPKGSRAVNTEADNQLLKTVFKNRISRSCQSVALRRTHPASQIASPYQMKKYTVGPNPWDHPSLSTSPSGTSTCHSPHTAFSHYIMSNNLQNSPRCCGNYRRISATTLAPSTVTNNLAHGSPMSTRAHIPHTRSYYSRIGSQSAYTSLSHINRPSLLRGIAGQIGDQDNISTTSTLLSRHRPRDYLAYRPPLGSRSMSTFMGSIGSIPAALAIVADDVSRYEGNSLAESHKSLKEHGVQFLDSLRILKNKPLSIFIAVCFFWAVGESPVIIYLPSYAVSQGTSPLQATSLYTSLGLGSITGRFLSGLTASDRNIGPIRLHIGCLGLAGTLVILSPLITSTLAEQIGFSFFFGIYTGSLVPLTSLIILEMIGARDLGHGFGFLSMSQGIGYLIGPPVASNIVRAIGYKNCFMFSGTILLLSSIGAMSILTLISFNENDGDQHSLPDFNNAVTRTPDSDQEEEVDEVQGLLQIEGDNLPKLEEANQNEKVKCQPEEVTLGCVIVVSDKTPEVDEKLGTILEVVGK